MIYAFIAFSILVIIVLVIIFRMMNEMELDFNNKLIKYVTKSDSNHKLLRYKMESLSKEIEDITEELDEKFDDRIKSLEIGKTILVERINKLESYIVYTSEGFKSDISALRGRNELTEHGYERVNSDILYLIGMIEALARADEVKEAYRHDTIRETSTKLFGNPNFIEDNWDLLYKNYCEEINADDDEEDQ